jgi:hypothetical protein
MLPCVAKIAVIIFPPLALVPRFIAFLLRVWRGIVSVRVF